jgi:hypothetical protein
MELEAQDKKIVLIGSLIGAFLGAGAAYLLRKAPSDLDDSDPSPVDAADILSLTTAIAILVRKVDDFRRRV